MIRKIRNNLNWKYALGEVLLIFIGISLAIGFQNWNDKRKRDILEKEVILQIYSDIKFSQGDIEADYSRLSFGLQALINIEGYLADDSPYVDSMCFDFYWIQHDEYTFPLKGGYESLKEKGLDLIKNDSIREFVQFTYEFGYPRISRETPFHPDINEYFSAYYQEHFTPNNDTSLVFEKETSTGTIRYPYSSNLANVEHQIHIGYVPKDFNALKRDPQFSVMLSQSKEYRRYKIIQYQNVSAITELLIRNIEEELGLTKE